MAHRPVKWREMRTGMCNIGGGIGGGQRAMAPLKFGGGGGGGQRILWPHLNFGQILTKIDLTLMIICEKTRNFL